MVTTAATYSYGGFEFGVDLDNLVTEALQVHARVPGISHLGATAANQNARLADIINRRVLAFLRQFPDLGQCLTSTIATVAGQVNYTPPTDLQGLAVARLVYDNTGSDPVNDLREVKYITQQQLYNLPSVILSGMMTQDYPDYWTYVRAANNRTQLTGSVLMSNGSAAVVGTSTLFTTELAQGSVISVYGQKRTVGTITDATHLTLTAAWSLATQTGVTAFKSTGSALNSINLYPWPAVDDIDIVVYYQIRPPQIIYTDIQYRASVPYMLDYIPQEFQGILAMGVAVDLLTLENQWERKQFLMQQLPGLMDEAQRVMSTPEAAENGAAQQPGEFSNLIDTNSLFAGMQPATLY